MGLQFHILDPYSYGLLGVTWQNQWSVFFCVRHWLRGWGRHAGDGTGRRQQFSLGALLSVVWWGEAGTIPGEITPDEYPEVGTDERTSRAAKRIAARQDEDDSWAWGWA